MKIGLVIASRDRAEILSKVLNIVVSQARPPDEIVISVVQSSDIPEMKFRGIPVTTVLGEAGLTRQRNKGLCHLIDKVDVIVFIDDDFIVGDDYFLNVERIFAQDNSIVGLQGKVIADGANSPGYTFEQGLRFVEDHRENPSQEPVTRDIEGTYGCNMAFRIVSIGSIRFDERLPLYGWQEDLDFCGALRGIGRIVTTERVWGAHLGTKRGKGSEVRLGYSQIINPAYIARKGNMSPYYAFRLASKNFMANLAKSIRPESYVDRRGRLRGNFIGIYHLALGRLTPEYVYQLK
jgi:glycosyltransferase involved in cell wall biosynthesis